VLEQSKSASVFVSCKWLYGVIQGGTEKRIDWQMAERYGELKRLLEDWEKWRNDQPTFFKRLLHKAEENFRIS